ncbi:regulator of (H+)-ATPase in vacuolar membrane [Dispira simplex]|nr:regulator of (H+)-ATPase in vacuolar membrane [Dispira simplex]
MVFLVLEQELKITSSNKDDQLPQGEVDLMATSQDIPDDDFISTGSDLFIYETAQWSLVQILHPRQDARLRILTSIPSVSCCSPSGIVALVLDNVILLYHPETISSTPTEGTRFQPGGARWTCTVVLGTDDIGTCVQWQSDTALLVGSINGVARWEHCHEDRTARDSPTHWSKTWEEPLPTPCHLITASADHGVFATLGRYDRLVKVWYLDSEHARRFLYLPHPYHVMDMAWRTPYPSGSAAATCSSLFTLCADGCTRIWSQQSTHEGTPIYALVCTLDPRQWLGSLPTMLPNVLVTSTSDQSLTKVQSNLPDYTFPYAHWVDKRIVQRALQSDPLQIPSAEVSPSEFTLPYLSTTQFAACVEHLTRLEELFMALLPDGSLAFWTVRLPDGEPGHMATPNLIYCSTSVHHDSRDLSATPTTAMNNLVANPWFIPGQPSNIGGLCCILRYQNGMVGSWSWFPRTIPVWDPIEQPTGAPTTALEKWSRSASMDFRHPSDSLVPFPKGIQITRAQTFSEGLVKSNNPAHLQEPPGNGLANETDRHRPDVPMSRFRELSEGLLGWTCHFTWHGHRDAWSVVSASPSDETTLGPMDTSWLLTVALSSSRPMPSDLEESSTASLPGLTNGPSDSQLTPDVQYEWILFRENFTTQGPYLERWQTGVLQGGYSDCPDPSAVATAWFPDRMGFLILTPDVLAIYWHAKPGRGAFDLIYTQSLNTLDESVGSTMGWTWIKVLNSAAIAHPITSSSKDMSTVCFVGATNHVYPRLYLVKVSYSTDKPIQPQSAGNEINSEELSSSPCQATLEPTAPNELLVSLALLNSDEWTAVSPVGDVTNFHTPVLITQGTTGDALRFYTLEWNSDSVLSNTADAPPLPSPRRSSWVPVWELPVTFPLPVRKVQATGLGIVAVLTAHSEGTELWIWDVHAKNAIPSAYVLSLSSSPIQSTHPPLWHCVITEPVGDLACSTTALGTPCVAYATGHHVHIVAPSVDYGSQWHVVRRLSLTGLEGLTINRLVWSCNGALVATAGHRIAVIRATATLGHSFNGETSASDSFLTRTVLPQYHPCVLTNLLKWNRQELVTGILRSLAHLFREIQDRRYADPQSALENARATGLAIQDFVTREPLERTQTPTAGTSMSRRNPLLDQYASLLTDTTSSGNRDRLSLGKNLDAGSALSKTDTEVLYTFLTQHSLPGVSRNGQVQLVAILDTLQYLTQHTLSLDTLGYRFAFFAHLHLQQTQVAYRTLLQRTASFDATEMDDLLLPFKHVAWASYSEGQKALVEFSLQTNNNRLLWSDVRRLRAPYWLRNDQEVRKLMETVAKHQYLHHNRDPLASTLYYLALKRKSVLLALWKASHGHPEQAKMAGFLKEDFTLPRWRTAANKNAYALIGKQRFELAAAFFLLADRLRDATSVCLRQLHDPALALAVCRSYEGDNGPVLQWLVKEQLLPLAYEKGDSWQIIVLTTLLSDYPKVRETLHNSLLPYNATEESSSPLAYDPDLLLLWESLEKWQRSVPNHRFTLNQPSETLIQGAIPESIIWSSAVPRALAHYANTGQPWVGWQVLNWWNDHLAQDTSNGQPSLSFVPTRNSNASFGNGDTLGDPIASGTLPMEFWSQNTTPTSRVGATNANSPTGSNIRNQQSGTPHRTFHQAHLITFVRNCVWLFQNRLVSQFLTFLGELVLTHTNTLFVNVTDAIPGQIRTLARIQQEGYFVNPSIRLSGADSNLPDSSKEEMGIYQLLDRLTGFAYLHGPVDAVVSAFTCSLQQVISTYQKPQLSLTILWTTYATHLVRLWDTLEFTTTAQLSTLVTDSKLSWGWRDNERLIRLLTHHQSLVMARTPTVHDLAASAGVSPPTTHALGSRLAVVLANVFTSLCLRAVIEHDYGAALITSYHYQSLIQLLCGLDHTDTTEDIFCHLERWCNDIATPNAWSKLPGLPKATNCPNRLTTTIDNDDTPAWLEEINNTVGYSGESTLPSSSEHVVVCQTLALVARCLLHMWARTLTSLSVSALHLPLVPYITTTLLPLLRQTELVIPVDQLDEWVRSLVAPKVSGTAVFGDASREALTRFLLHLNSG